MVGKTKAEGKNHPQRELLKEQDAVQVLEETLGELKQKYISILQHSRQGIILFQNDPPSLIWVNADMAKLFGLGLRPIKSLSLKAFQSFLHPDDWMTLLNHYRECLQGRPPVGPRPLRGTRKDRAPIFLEYNFVRVNHMGHPAALGIFVDHTGRKKLEDILLDSQESFSRRSENLEDQTRSYIEELKENEKKLRLQKEELTRISQELWETNRAVSVLARNIDKNKELAELRVAQTVCTKIMPIVESLKKEKILEKHRAELEVLSVYLKELVEGNEKGVMTANALNFLSPIEMRIAALIKNGLASKDIGNKLNISLETVKTHRRNIRKKLQLQNQDINLPSFLKSKIF